MRKGIFGLLLLAAAVAGTLQAESRTAQPYGVAEGNEELLLRSLQSLGARNLEAALKDIETLTAQRPDFRLAQLVYADLMASRGSALTAIGQPAAADKKLQGLISEAKARLLIEMEKPGEDMVPAAMVQMAADQRYAIVMDTRLSRLFVFENHSGVPHLVKDFYASYGRGGVGKEKQGDLKTPLGVYFVTGRMTDAQLPSRYGSGALPINYPNVWDDRLGRTGNGIWVHGSPLETYSRSPLASEGCISLTNPDFVELDRMVNIRTTPVLIGEQIRWLQRDDWIAQQEPFVDLVEAWRQDWESRDSERYLRHYSRHYRDEQGGFERFSAHKRRVNSAKSYIEVGLKNLSIFRYPDNPDLMVVSFLQDYRSSNYKGESEKRQYWVREDQGWRIAYEGAPSNGKP